MLTYTDSEKNTIINLLSNIIEADSIIHPKEVEYMNYIMKELNYTILNLDHMHEKDLYLNKRLFKLMTLDKQEEVETLMRNMAECDGNVDPRESEIIDLLCN